MLFSVFYFFLLEFFSIFQNFQYFSVFLGIFQYFSVFFSIFGTFQYFSCFSVFSVFFSNFQYSADKEDILSLSTTRDDAAQDVFKKKRRRLLHSQIITWVSHSLFLIFQISETRSIKCPCPVNFTASLCYMSCPLGKLCTCQNKNTKGQWCSLSRYFEMFEIAALWIQASWMQAFLKKYEIVPSGHNDGSRKHSLSRDCDAWAALHWRQSNALYLMFRCDISWRIRIEDSPIHFFWCSYLRQVAKYLLSTLLTTSNV